MDPLGHFLKLGELIGPGLVVLVFSVLGSAYLFVLGARNPVGVRGLPGALRALLFILGALAVFLIGCGGFVLGMVLLLSG